MRLRRVHLLALFVPLFLTLTPRSTGAQTPKRWIAGPQLLAPVHTIGPNGGLQTINGVADLEILNANMGWAISGRGFLQFDGRHWRATDDSASARQSLNALDLVSPTNGWAVGSNITYTGSEPPFDNPEILRFNGTRWDPFILPGAGTNSTPHSALRDVSALPDGNAWIVGDTRPDYTQPQRPWLLFFDGETYQDRTPAEWRFGYLSKIQIVGPNELWIAGQIREGADTSPTNLGRPVLLHLKDGVWSEAALPTLGTNAFYVEDLIMRDASEGWTTLREIGPCASGALLHYSNGTWTRIDPATHGNAPLALGLIPGTNRGWATLYESCSNGGLRYPSRRMQFDSGTFTPETSGGARFLPSRYALLSDQVQWAVGDGAFMRYTDEALPTDRVAANVPGGRYFSETGHTISGIFRRYYESHGLNLKEPGISPRESLALFGYPVSEPFEETNPDTGEVLLVQYFERARMEYHPNNPEPYKVLLGRLGFNTLLQQSQGYLNRSPEADQPAPANCDRFAETGYTLCPPFRSFWHTGGGLPVFGFPLTDAFPQTNPTDGKEYLTQWFERERLEHHPENRGTPYEVLLGLLGSEELRVRGYLP